MERIETLITKKKTVLSIGRIAAVALLFPLAIACTQEQTTNTLRAPAYPLVTIDPYTSAWSAADKLYDAPITHWTGQIFPFDGFITVDGQEYRFMGSNGFYAPIAESVLTGDWESLDTHMERTYILDSIPDEVYYRYANRKPAMLYINGVETLNGRRKRTGQILKMNEEEKKLLKVGENTISATSYNDKAERTLEFELLRRIPGNDCCAEQISADVQATQTHYSFNCGPIRLDLSFTAPFLADNLELVGRPVNYVNYSISSTDGAEHDVSLLFSADASGWAVNKPEQEVTTESFTLEDSGLSVAKGGSVEQNILGRKGDDVRIDWGYFYLAAPAPLAASVSGSQMALSGPLGKISKASGHFMVAYDDLWSIQYFNQNLRPYWNRDGSRKITDVLAQSEKEYSDIIKACDKFDRKLFAECQKAGGRKYAELCALAYRQAFAAHKLVELPNGELGFFSKENNSNGSIGTVDITYPSSPVFLKYNPELCMALMNHIYDYSESGRWTKPFPAHDVGTYPIANGQTYPTDMPVEEGGNILILTAAACHFSNDWSYAGKHWDTASVWEDYLEQFGLDPENQLCTDDFAGRMAHNANLSVKAILGIASYALIAEHLGHKDIADAKMAIARDYASRWAEAAADGDHYSLTFDRKGTWSQKYNLVWDRLLGLNIFPKEVTLKELAYYPSVMGKYGLPLDCRSTYTKSDWIMWTASMAGSKEEFEAIIAPTWDFYNTSPDRIPMTDWYYTDTPHYCEFIARSVVGGYFIKLLY